jgi:hypothetical protein
MPSLSTFDLELLSKRDLLRTANIYWNALVDFAGNKLKRTLMSGRGCAAGLLGHHRERYDLVHQAQLA